VATDEFDLVVEGTAEQIKDPATVVQMAERWSAQGWPARVDDTSVALTADFSAPSAGPPPWVIYRLVPDRTRPLRPSSPEGQLSGGSIRTDREPLFRTRTGALAASTRISRPASLDCLIEQLTNARGVRIHLELGAATGDLGHPLSGSLLRPVARPVSLCDPASSVSRLLRKRGRSQSSQISGIHHGRVMVP